MYVYVEVQDGIPSIIAPKGCQVVVNMQDQDNGLDDSCVYLSNDNENKGALLFKQPWADNDKKIAPITWHVQDVYEVAKQDGYEISEETAQETLNRLQKYHDANVGINWDVIRTTLEIQLGV